MAVDAPTPAPTPSAAPPLQRFDGRDLGPKPHIVVLGSSKVGNFVVTVPLLQALRRRYPQAALDFWGSDLTRDFESRLDAVDWRISWDSAAPDLFQQLAEAARERQQQVGSVDLLVNCDGFNPLTQVLASWLRPRWVAGVALAANGRRDVPWGERPEQRFLADPDWDSQAFLERYQGCFRSNYIAELFCRLAFLEPDFSHFDLPSEAPGFPVPDVLIHCTTTRAAKIWPFDRWQQVIDWCERQSISIGLVGSAPSQQKQDYHAGAGEEQLLAGGYLQDLRGRTSLIQLAGAAKQARAVVSVDAGPLHIAAAVGTPTLAVVGNDANDVGASPIRLWMPRSANVARTVSDVRCDGCDEHRFRNDGCVMDEHLCMLGVGAQQIIHWLQQVLQA